MINPFVSIIIPSYNNGHLLERVLNSLYNQTYTNWEAIIIDNYSSDSTDSILNQIVDNRIRVIKIRNNGVIAKSRNLGIINANGSWIAFLDSDDWWDINKLEQCVEYSGEKYDLIYHTLGMEFETPGIKKKRLLSRNINSDCFRDLLINGNFILNSSVFVKKEILDKVGLISEKKSLVGAEDYNYLLRISKVTNNFKFISERLGYYFISKNGISRKNMSQCHFEAVKGFLPSCDKKSRKLVLANILYIDVNYNFRNNNNIISKSKLLFIILNGTFQIKLKALFILINAIGR